GGGCGGLGSGVARGTAGYPTSVACFPRDTGVAHLHQEWRRACDRHHATTHPDPCGGTVRGLREPVDAMRTLRLLALATVIAAGCRLDKLLQSAGPPPPPTAYGAAGLAFTAQPESARAGQRIPPVQVTVRDSANAPATKFTGLVTVTLDRSPGGASLNGRRTVPAVNGVATFTDLHIDRAG